MAGRTLDESRRVDEMFDDVPLSGFDPGTTVLVSGPPMVGKYELVVETLAGGIGRNEGAIVISTRHDETAVIDDFERVVPGFDRSLLGIVECVSDQHGEGTGYTGDVRVRRASSPADLTGVGIGASELMSDLHDEGVTAIGICVDSLSTLLLYTEFDRMARFLHVLAGRIDRSGGLGLFVINPGTIEAGQYDQLKTLFDGLLEIRERDEMREVRIRGLTGVDANWRAYDPPRIE